MVRNVSIFTGAWYRSPNTRIKGPVIFIKKGFTASSVATVNTSPIPAALASLNSADPYVKPEGVPSVGCAKVGCAKVVCTKVVCTKVCHHQEEEEEEEEKKKKSC
jgi:hypothetical protein